ncbi:glycosyltransferase family 2 protein [Herbiconiux sp. YIM B11900]|uniref:glycosyltransferase family 2 protein n=1 Tax=Herbiconiux sp. YIM B11900 TaxID=3404131 RepID=UPI003F83FAA9
MDERRLTPDTSCVIPTHGRPEFLREALESVFRQTTLPAEIVVVSDLEDDATAELCRSLADDVPIPVLYVVNAGGSGASSSRNLGAARATGDVLAFLDDDDKWEPGYLAAASAILESSAADGVATWIQMFRGEEVAPGLRIAPGLPAAATASENPGVTGSNFLVRRRAFDQIGGFDVELPVKNDGDFFFRFLLAGLSYAVNPESLVLQRKHAGGQLTGRTAFRAAGLEKYLQKHRANLTLGDRRFIRLSAARIRYHAATTKREKVKQMLLGAFNSSPRTLRSSLEGRSTKDFWIVAGFDGAPRN